MNTQNYYEVKLKKWTEFPGPGKSQFGEYSGEAFLTDILWPAYQRARRESKVLLINMDGTAGFSSSFAREAILGLIRKAKSPSIKTEVVVRLTDLKILDEYIQGWLRAGGESERIAA